MQTAAEHGELLSTAARRTRGPDRTAPGTGLNRTGPPAGHGSTARGDNLSFLFGCSRPVLQNHRRTVVPERSGFCGTPPLGPPGTRVCSVLALNRSGSCSTRRFPGSEGLGTDPSASPKAGSSHVTSRERENVGSERRDGSVLLGSKVAEILQKQTDGKKTKKQLASVSFVCLWFVSSVRHFNHDPPSPPHHRCADGVAGVPREGWGGGRTPQQHLDGSVFTWIQEASASRTRWVSSHTLVLTGAAVVLPGGGGGYQERRRGGVLWFRDTVPVPRPRPPSLSPVPRPRPCSRSYRAKDDFWP